MGAQELAVWSMALGAIGALGLAQLAQFARSPSRAQWHAVGYHAAVFLMVMVLSGVGAHVVPAVDSSIWRVAQVVVGPLCVGLSDLWIGGWLYAPHRDRFMAAALRSSAGVLLLAAAGCLLLPQHLQLPAAAAVSMAGGSLTAWLTTRAYGLGDSLAGLMAVGCLLTLPAIAGLYAVAWHWHGLSLGWHATFASCAALSNAVTAAGLWQRERQEQHARQQSAISSVIDPVTRLCTGRSLVHRIVQAQRRRQRSGRDGAVLTVVLFDIDRLRTELGTTGLHEVYIAMASRIQRRVGAVNMVGRYYEGCFVALVDSLPSLPWLRTLALRLAAGLRRPIVATRRSGDRAELMPDIGVGIVHLSRPVAQVDAILADAQRMALAARSLRSRTAIRDPSTGRPVAAEDAQLGERGARRLVRTAS